MELITAGGLAGKTTLLKSCYQASPVNDVLSLLLRTLASDNVSEHTIAKFDRLAEQSVITDDFEYGGHHITTNLQLVKMDWDPNITGWDILSTLNKFNIVSMTSQLNISISDPAAAAVAAASTQHGTGILPQVYVEYLAFVAGRVFDLSNTEELVNFNAAFIPPILTRKNSQNAQANNLFDVYTLWYSSSVDNRTRENTPIMQLIVDDQGTCYSFVRITAFNQGIQLRPGSYIQHIPESCSFNLMKELVSTATVTKLFALYNIKGAVVDNINVLLNELVQHGNAYSGGKYSSACNAFMLYLKQRNVNFLASHNEAINYNDLSNMSATDYIRTCLFGEGKFKSNFNEIPVSYKLDYGSAIARAQDIYNDTAGRIMVVTETGQEIEDSRISGYNSATGSSPGDDPIEAVTCIGAYPSYFAIWKSDRLMRGTETENNDRGFYYLDAFTAAIKHSNDRTGKSPGLITIADISQTYKYIIYLVRLYKPSTEATTASVKTSIITIPVPNGSYGEAKKKAYVELLNQIKQELDKESWIDRIQVSTLIEMLTNNVFVTKIENGICRYNAIDNQVSSNPSTSLNNFQNNYNLFGKK